MFKFRFLIISALISLPATATATATAQSAPALTSLPEISQELRGSVDEVLVSSIVTRVYPQGDGRFVITLKDDPISCSNVNVPSYIYVEVGKNGVTQEGLNLMFSLALVGAASKQSVSIFFDSSSYYCYINRMSLNY